MIMQYPYRFRLPNVVETPTWLIWFERQFRHTACGLLR